jgi:hypothetical protein
MAHTKAGINYTILRFNFTEDIMNRIAYFAKLHQFEDRHAYKTNWNRWCEEQQLIVDVEIRRLTDNGYEGDVKEKMYKAGRYYFRKKQEAQEPKAQAQEPKAQAQEPKVQAQEPKAQAQEPKAQVQVQAQAQTQQVGESIKIHVKKSSKYTTMNKAVLEEMDNHIISSMRINRAYTPAGGYTEFCERYAAILLIETERLKSTERLSDDMITCKIKKTYKNRYFMMTR